MAQGARVSRNLFHDNASYDLFFEVDHGPILVDNNILLSARSFFSHSHGVAFAHNLFGGTNNVAAFDSRLTPFLKEHSTELGGLHDNPRGDDRYYNNIFAARADLTQYDASRMPVWMDGNVFLNGAKPSTNEISPLVEPKFDPALKLVQEPGGFMLEMKFDRAWRSAWQHKIVTTSLLGRAVIPNAAYEQPDGAPLRIDTDYFGHSRTKSNPTPGPFEKLADKLKVR
jgi:alpha-N-arabinofuranosidase